MARVVSFRTGKMYSISQAARLGKTTPQTVRRWLFGSVQPGHSMKPVFARRVDDRAPSLSFLELAEVLVVARFRKSGGKAIPLERLRRAHSFARIRLGIAHPFASDLFRVEGGHIMHDFEGESPGKGKLAVDVGGNYVLPLDFQDALSLFDFDATDWMATRWYPMGKDSPVVIDPEMAGGVPSLHGFNIRTESIERRFKSGWSMQEISEDFEIPIEAVEALLRALLDLSPAAA